MSDRILMVGNMNDKRFGGGYERIGRVYSIDGIAPTVTARDYKDPIRIIVEVENGQGNSSRKYLKSD